MEESSAKEVTQGRVICYSDSPRYFLQEAIRAILKCLGLESTTPEKSPSSEQKENEESSQESSSSTTKQGTDPPSTPDPGVMTFEDGASTTRSLAAMPPRPPISSGSGPQTN